jgi:hypothetical protein
MAPDVFFARPPQEMTEHIVLHMALTYSDAEAAHLLGLTDAQVAAAKKACLDRMKADVRQHRPQGKTLRRPGRR